MSSKNDNSNESEKTSNKKFHIIKNSNKKINVVDDLDIDDDNVKEVIVERDNGFNIVEVIVIIIVSVFFGIVVGYLLKSTKPFGEKVTNEVQEIVSTYDKILNEYYGEVDEKELMDAAISGMISVLDDPYSSFMDSNNTDLFNESVDGTFIGLGVTIMLDDSGVKILEIIENSPASKANLKVDDFILKINDVSVEGKSLYEVSEMIGNKKDNNITLLVRRGDAEVSTTAQIGVVTMPSVSSKIFDSHIGYISIDTFAANTSNEFTKHLSKLEKDGIDSLIIDVRDNSGGRVGQVNEILDLFMKKNTVLYKIQSKDATNEILATSSEYRKYPVNILINKSSASASEILTMSFKEKYKKCLVVGETSYGKGTIQTAVKLSSGASIKYTTQKWLSPSGEWIHGVGVVPNEVVANDENYYLNPTDETDLQLQKAIELLSNK